MEDPNCLSQSEMKLLKVGNSVRYLEQLCKFNDAADRWKIVQVVDKGIVVESTKYGGHRHLIEWHNCIKLELPEDFYEQIC